jgi:hypothetical protein
MEYSRDPEHIAKDIAELELLMTHATREHSKQLITNEINTLTKLKNLVCHCYELIYDIARVKCPT